MGEKEFDHGMATKVRSERTYLKIACFGVSPGETGLESCRFRDWEEAGPGLPGVLFCIKLKAALEPFPHDSGKRGGKPFFRPWQPGLLGRKDLRSLR